MPRMCAAVLVLALGVTAKIPDWLQKKPQFPSIVNMHSKLMQQNQGRRLQAIMSEECMSACPGVEAMIKQMMGGSGRRLDGHEEEASAAQTVEMYCPHMGALQCTNENRAKCSDTPDTPATEKEEADFNGLKCLCTCPDLADSEDTKKMCANKDKVLGCLTGETSCSAMVKQMGGTEAADIDCKIFDNKCNEKGEKLVPCVGEEKMGKWGPCDEAAGKEETMEDSCCPILEDIIGCYTQECIDLLLARNQLMANAGDEDSKKEVKKNIAMGSSCAGSGMPTSEAEMADKLDAATGGGAAGSADDAPAQTLPVLALSLAITACIA